MEACFGGGGRRKKCYQSKNLQFSTKPIRKEQDGGIKYTNLCIEKTHGEGKKEIKTPLP